MKKIFKDFFNDFRLVNETNDAPFGSPQGGERIEPHLSLTLGTDKGIGLINLSDKVGSALF